MNVFIRQECKDDYPLVFEVNYHAFGRGDEGMLVNALRESDAFIPELSVVAVKDTAIIGYILFTKIYIVNSISESFDSLALAPVAVMPGFQHQGIGSLLIKSGLEKCCALGYRSVIVLGHDTYYPKFGFRPASEWGIQSPFDVPDDSFMAIELVTGSLKRVNGMVVYAKEFGII